MSLYLKYRPQSFDAIVSNKETVEALTKMMASEDRPHAYLFTGETGCGKTTLARIVAKELGVVGTSLRELNSADVRGIDTIREIIKQSNFKPIEGPVSVWIIDEVHSATKDAQNALLKLLEDTPEHVYIILATTDPQKLLPTVKNRCSTFAVKPLNDVEMLSLLRDIVKAEGEQVAKVVYQQIIQDSFGHVRNALQILDQVLMVDFDSRLETATRIAAEQSESIELCRALLGNAPWKKVANILVGLKNQEPESIRRHVLGYAQSVLLKGADNVKAAAVLELFIEPFYNSGFPGLVYAAYSVTHS